ncbi:MAG: LPS assembly protein LptD [Gammaproteobacteria bacterium]|nr:LPS assembly protein LptD [Gammaproteobacteria bacterium]MDH5652451.1 LPS assembly protein LptD [Gammaproteobacteria bacterium]
MRRPRLTPALLLLSLLPVISSPLSAAEAPATTNPPPSTAGDSRGDACRFPPVLKKPLQGKEAAPDQTQLQADEADMNSKTSTIFSGSVIIQRGEQRIEADKAEYFHATEDFNATGHIRFFDSNLLIEGDAAQMNLKNNQGVVKDARYRALDKNVRGTAQSLSVQPDQLVMEKSTYTTCRPGDTDWELSAGKITLNDKTRQGSASNVVLDFKGVPIFYLPYMRFPIGDQRLSGILYPGFGSSDEHGTELSIPYYWNIAPNYDATLTPHSMSKRGVMLETEFRYLHASNRGELMLDYLDHDKEFGDTRRQVHWNHRGKVAEGWSTAIDYKAVSDVNYLVDFGGTLGNTGTTHLLQTASLNYNNPNWLFNGVLQNYQTLQGSVPYRRAPQLRLTSRFVERDNRLNFNLQSEWVRFDHTDTSLLQADRFHLQPTLNYPLRSSAFFFIPAVTGYYTQYQYIENAPGSETSVDRAVPVYSLDTGLFLERDTTWGGAPLLHTLEPRLFFVYTPYREQGSLPVFDSGLQTFSYNGLFRENRFSSVDRIGDTRHLAAVLTTRLQHQLTGAELFSAAIGQVRYFDDRRVTLPGGSAETSDGSSYVARITAIPASGWQFSSDLQWDPTDKRTEYSTNRLQYRSQDLILNLGYRYRENELATRDTSLLWRMSPRWRVLAANQYDLRNQRRLESVAGLDYDSCCWGLRLLLREYYNTANPDNYDQGIYLSLELKGLSSLGQSEQAATILKNAIPGYRE